MRGEPFFKGKDPSLLGSVSGLFDGEETSGMERERDIKSYVREDMRRCAYFLLQMIEKYGAKAWEKHMDQLDDGCWIASHSCMTANHLARDFYSVIFPVLHISRVSPIFHFDQSERVIQRSDNVAEHPLLQTHPNAVMMVMKLLPVSIFIADINRLEYVL